MSQSQSQSSVRAAYQPQTYAVRGFPVSSQLAAWLVRSHRSAPLDRKEQIDYESAVMGHVLNALQHRPYTNWDAEPLLQKLQPPPIQQQQQQTNVPKQSQQQQLSIVEQQARSTLLSAMTMIIPQEVFHLAQAYLAQGLDPQVRQGALSYTSLQAGQVAQHILSSEAAQIIMKQTQQQQQQQQQQQPLLETPSLLPASAVSSTSSSATLVAAAAGTTKTRRERLLAASSQEKQPVLVGTSREMEREFTRLEPKAKDLRPLSVLKEAFIHINKKSVTSFSETPAEGLYWLGRQLKGMRQDLTCQRLVNNSFAVKVYERHARLALRLKDFSEYVQCQAQLKSYYQGSVSQKSLSSSNLAFEEFTMYRLLFLALCGDSSRHDFVGEVHELSLANEQFQSRAAAIFQKKFINNNNNNSRNNNNLGTLESLVIHEANNNNNHDHSSNNNQNKNEEILLLNHSTSPALDANEISKVFLELDSQRNPESSPSAMNGCLIRRPAVAALLQCISFLEQGQCAKFQRAILQLVTHSRNKALVSCGTVPEIPSLLLVVDHFLTRLRQQKLLTLVSMHKADEISGRYVAEQLGFLTGIDAEIEDEFGFASKTWRARNLNSNNNNKKSSKSVSTSSGNGIRNQLNRLNQKPQQQQQEEDLSPPPPAAQLAWTTFFESIKFKQQKIGQYDDPNFKFDLLSLKEATSSYFDYLREGGLGLKAATVATN